MSLLHKTDAYRSPNEGSDSRNFHRASNDSSQLIVLPLICWGIAVAGELENISSGVDRKEFWRGYKIMSGIIFVLLAMELLTFGVLRL